MFCKNCGKEIHNESKFCQFCGVSIANVDTGKKEESKVKEMNVWDEFAKIYDSSGEERKLYNDLSSNEAWELINRISKNTFESFIDENRDQLNKQPYKVIEDLESLFKFSVVGGYWLWTAEHIVKNGRTWKLKTIILEQLIDEWTESLKGLDEFIKNTSQDLGDAIMRYQSFKINSFLETSPSVKELPVEFIDKIKTEVLGKILWGYFIGISELKYIK